MTITNEERVITIDGGEGTGKSTVAKMISSKLGMRLLNSGQLYRIITHICAIEHKIDIHDTDYVARIARLNAYRISIVDGIAHLDNKPVGDEIRTPEIGRLTKYTAKIPDVRMVLRPFQRDCVCREGLVAEGRDMGTIVFPKALVKIFLTARLETCAHRRFEEFKRKNIETTFEAVLADVETRNTEDTNREHSPLKCPVDGYVIETDNLSVEGTAHIVEQLWQSRVLPLVA